LHSYFYCYLSFSFQGGHQTLKHKLVKKADHFHTAQQQDENCERDCVCKGWEVLTRQRNNETVELLRHNSIVHVTQ